MAKQSGSSGRAKARRKTPGTTGRVTPKGGARGGSTSLRATGGGGGGGGGGTVGRDGTVGRGGSVPTTGEARPTTAPASGRYTPPVRNEARPSPTWVPVLMFALFGLGTLVIIVNYFGLLPGGTDNLYLLGGLAAITVGLFTATQYR